MECFPEVHVKCPNLNIYKSEAPLEVFNKYLRIIGVGRMTITCMANCRRLHRNSSLSGVFKTFRCLQIHLKKGGRFISHKGALTGFPPRTAKSRTILKISGEIPLVFNKIFEKGAGSSFSV